MDFDKLYQEHAKLVWHYVYAKCQDPELANDIVQTTFLKAISQIEGFRGECKLTAWLCRHFGVSPDQIIRHYDITGKDCPKYFVEHEDAWEQFLADVRAKAG